MLVLTDDIRKCLSKRPKNSHKADFGHVLMIGGNIGMLGAIFISALAAARVGAGLISIATKREHATSFLQKQPEFMWHPVDIAKDLEPLLAKADVIAIGPGLGRDEWAEDLWKAMKNVDRSLVIDADALRLLGNRPYANSKWILTPHPGEAAHLLHTDIETITRDREAAVTELQKKYGGVVVLKGAGSLIKTERELAKCEAGNPGMASAGMGDMLTGIIAGLLAQGLSFDQAAECGVYLHARAGDLAAKEKGERGLLATDLLPYLQRLVNPDEDIF